MKNRIKYIFLSLILMFIGMPVCLILYVPYWIFTGKDTFEYWMTPIYDKYVRDLV